MPAFPVRSHISIDSTNEEARRLAADGDFGPLWICSGEQTGGRGRLGRNWVSKPGNVYSTLLIRIDAALTVVPQIGFVCALAVYDAIHSCLPSESAYIRLKWPNDCLVNGRKLAGILAEKVRDDPSCFAVGCGINVEHSPNEVRYPTAALFDFGSKVSTDQVFERYATAMERWFLMWDRGRNFEGVKAEWVSRSLGIGETITVTQDRRVQQGRFTGLAEDGAMLLDDGSSIVRIYSGDVQFPSLEVLRKSTV